VEIGICGSITTGPSGQGKGGWLRGNVLLTPLLYIQVKVLGWGFQDLGESECSPGSLHSSLKCTGQVVHSGSNSGMWLHSPPMDFYLWI
jgi:hypothetical protein